MLAMTSVRAPQQRHWPIARHLLGPVLSLLPVMAVAAAVDGVVAADADAVDAVVVADAAADAAVAVVAD